jgi:hypothetical protein
MSKQKKQSSSNKEKLNANLKREKPISQGFTLLCNKLYLVSFSCSSKKNTFILKSHNGVKIIT